MAVNSQPHGTGCTDAARQALVTEVQGLDSVAAGLAARAVDYVLTGQGESVIADIAAAQIATNNYGGQRGLLHSGLWLLGVSQLAFLEQHGPHGVPVLYRFGQLLAAAQPNWRLQLGRKTNLPANVNWLAHLLFEVVGAHGPPRAGGKNDHVRQADTVVALLGHAGVDIRAFFEMIYMQPDRYGLRAWSSIRRRLQGLDTLFEAQADVLLSVFEAAEPPCRVEIVEDMGRLGVAKHTPFRAFVWDQACGSSKTMAKAAIGALAGLPLEDAVALARATFAAKGAAARRKAAEALLQLAGTRARKTLLAQAKVEKGQSMQAAMMALVERCEAVASPPDAAASRHAKAEDGATVMRAIDGSDIIIPPMPPLPPDTPLPAEALAPLRAAIPAYNEKIRALVAAHAARMAAAGFPPRPIAIDEIDADTAIPELLAFLNGSGQQHAFNNWLFGRVGPETWDPPEIRELFAHPDFTKWHLLRLGNYHTTRGRDATYMLKRFDYGTQDKAITAYCTQCPDVRVPIGIIGKLGANARGIVRGMLHQYARVSLLERPIPTLAYHVYDNLDVVQEALGMAPKADLLELDAAAALDLLGELPKVPDRFRLTLLDLAVGSRKTLHRRARALLKDATGIEAAIVARLSDGKKEVRAAAAAWLGERGQPGAAAALARALKKEKSEEGRAAMLTALSRLGADISDYVSDKALKQEAEKGLAKWPLTSLEWWFPFDRLPVLQWGSGKKVDPLIIKWWVVLADKLKHPGGNALLDFHLDRLRPEDAGALGLFVLSAFVHLDTTPGLYDTWVNWVAKQPPGKQRYPSSTENRGILALASRAPGAEAVEIVRRYLKEHGSRTSQAKSLLEALAANPAPDAIQAVLAAANRLKQKSVQAYAAKLVQSVAERRGWTPEELADRTMPTGGFDQAGELILPCGEGRDYKAVYNGDGRVQLFNAAGKPVKSLPETSDGDGQVTASKKALSAARKAIKQVEKDHHQRLYESMCARRTWNPVAWHDLLLRHPIVGPMCRRLVWLGLDEDGMAVASFRPLDDGSLTGNDDEAVDIGGLAAIGVAHAALMPKDAADAWQAHLSDYEVRPLFQQFGRPLLVASTQLAEATEIDDRKGWMLDNFKLANAAGKLGYERGPVGDAGHISTYVKPFTGAGISAVIEFTGHYVAETKQVSCALLGLSFHDLGQGGRAAGIVRAIGRVPTVILSECWNDLQAIAAAGGGYDAAWQKKTSF